MKKLILLAILAIFSITALAKETVKIFYAFSAADSIANYGRTLVDVANRQQDKYLFVFDVKPGAGGAVSAQYVDQNPSDTILMSSAAFFVRPNFYPKDSHSIDHFQQLKVLCTAPMAIASTKYVDWKSVPQDRPVTIGISGLGATSHLDALQIQKRFPQLQPVPFKSTTDAINALEGGFIDMSVGFLSEYKPWQGYNEGHRAMTIMGITGKTSVAGVPTLASQGFKLLDQMSNPQQLIISSKISKAKREEWFAILDQAARSKEVLDSYAIDDCVPNTMTSQQNLKFFDRQKKLWHDLSQTVKID
jgi:tripartite-type tricarboxylate transporter receptor subunit TctC